MHDEKVLNDISKSMGEIKKVAIVALIGFPLFIIAEVIIAVVFNTYPEFLIIILIPMFVLVVIGVLSHKAKKKIDKLINSERERTSGKRRRSFNYR